MFRKKLKKINLGCGIYYEKEYLNIDIDESVKPDLVRDVTRGLPYDTESIDEVRTYHFLEHLNPDDFIFVLKEVWRVLKKRGKIDIQVPMGITDDPTHKTFFNEDSFDLFFRSKLQHYYKNGMSWQLILKEVIQQKYQTLHIEMRKIIK